MMPAMSPSMTEGTITRWKKKEGEAFFAGDVLVQIESDIATIDVEAESAGILSRILLPDGTTNVPVEQVIALVDRTENLLAIAQSPASPFFNLIPSPGIHVENFTRPFLSPAHRSSRFHLHSGRHHRGLTTRHARGPSLTILPPSPRTISAMSFSSACSPKMHIHDPRTAPARTGGTEEPTLMDGEESQVDSASIRRMIISNLAQASSLADVLRTGVECDTEDYFDGIL